MEKQKLIKCPKCGCSYFLSEIFLPHETFANHGRVIRDEEGSIIYYDGQEDDFVEEYKCDRCDSLFEAIISVSISTQLKEVEDFEQDYETSLYKERIKLDEGTLFEEEE